MDNWVLNQHTTHCMEYSKDNTSIYKFIYKAFCINTVYFTPKDTQFIVVKV